MEPACIRHTDLPGTSKLFADFVYRFDRVAPFYAHDPSQPASYEAAARQIRYPDDRRAAMAAALAKQNPGNPLLERFAQPGTVAVVTGQQVGLFGGPAYTIYKAMTAARLAADLTERGIPAVPIFWLATEDHDFAEINHVWLFDANRRPVKLVVAEQSGQRPVGDIALDSPPLDQLREALRGFPHGPEVASAVANTCEATMGSAFRALFVKLMAQIGLLTLDPLDASVRAIGAPFMADAVGAAPELKSALLDRTRALTDAGYHAQVLVEPKTSIFFLLDNGQRLTLRPNDVAALRDRAADVSPNALLRPVWQDYLLPTVAYAGGPAEVAYFAQSQVLYERLLGRMPVVLPRASFTLLDARAVRLLNRFHLGVTDTFVREESLKERIAQTVVPGELRASFQTTAAAVTQKLDALKTQVAAFDPTLGASLQKSQAKMLYQMEKSRKKVERETLRRDARASGDAEYLSNLLYPHGHLQERLYSILPFLAQYGMDLPRKLYDAVRPDCPDHRVIEL